jgi:hypothetical protein
MSPIARVDVVERAVRRHVDGRVRRRPGALEVERIDTARRTIRSGRAFLICATSGSPTSESSTVTVSRPSAWRIWCGPGRAGRFCAAPRRARSAVRRRPRRSPGRCGHSLRSARSALRKRSRRREGQARRRRERSSCDPLPERPLHHGHAEQQRADAEDRRVRPRAAAERRRARGRAGRSSSPKRGNERSGQRSLGTLSGIARLTAAKERRRARRSAATR